MVTDQDTDLGDGVVTSVVLPLPLRDCWPYFREPVLIREWHGWEDPGLDAEVREIFVGGATVSEDHCTLHLGTHLFRLSEDEGQTRVDVHRSPLADGGEWEQFLPDIDEGWTSFLQQLRFKLSRHRDAPRHTRFYGGTPVESVISPVQQLGLGQVGSLTVGEKYAASVAADEALTGTLWFVSELQVGVTVDSWGDGLLIVTNGARGGPPYTSGQVMLTTYGHNDVERPVLAERWDAWWNQHYRTA